MQLSYKYNVNPEATLFPQLFANQPNVVRQFLRSALRVTALQELYREARRDDECPLSTAILQILNIKIQVSEKDLQQIPRTGPVVFVANHPHGFLDGFVLDHVLQQIRADMKLLVNELISSLDGMAHRCIAVDVLGSRNEKNIQAARRSISWLKEGHCLLMFPSGEVSHWRPEEKRIADGPWSDFPARCGSKANATIVPIFIAGVNSLTFQLAGLIHPPLRTARLAEELFNKRASTVEVRIGKPILARDLLQVESKQPATEYVRARVYVMGHRAGTAKPGLRAIRLPVFLRQQPVCSPAEGISAAVDVLHRAGRCLVENDRYAVYADLGKNIPTLLSEIGRLRELTFRQVGEGTGKAIDLDEFDAAFTHLILWHKESAAIAGSYRLAWTNEVLPGRGIDGLYTAKLFRYGSEFFSRLGPAVELGRSFIIKEHQREIMPLFLLWQGIGHCVAHRPESPVLFGAVSISASYSETSRAMIVDLLRKHSFRNDLDRFVTPRRPFVSRLIQKPELYAITRCLPEVEDLPIADIDPQGGIPVLLRQYLRLGGKVAGFNVDPQFSNALDALLILDLRETPSRLLTKYMGAENASAFLAGQAEPLARR
jgi:putative hemolysin